MSLERRRLSSSLQESAADGRIWGTAESLLASSDSPASVSVNDSLSSQDEFHLFPLWNAPPRRPVQTVSGLTRPRHIRRTTRWRINSPTVRFSTEPDLVESVHDEVTRSRAMEDNHGRMARHTQYSDQLHGSGPSSNNSTAFLTRSNAIRRSGREQAPSRRNHRQRRHATQAGWNDPSSLITSAIRELALLHSSLVTTTLIFDQCETVAMMLPSIIGMIMGKLHSSRAIPAGRNAFMSIPRIHTSTHGVENVPYPHDDDDAHRSHPSSAISTNYHRSSDTTQEVLDDVSYAYSIFSDTDSDPNAEQILADQLRIVTHLLGHGDHLSNSIVDHDRSPITTHEVSDDNSLDFPITIDTGAGQTSSIRLPTVTDGEGSGDHRPNSVNGLQELLPHSENLDHLEDFNHLEARDSAPSPDLAMPNNASRPAIGMDSIVDLFSDKITHRDRRRTKQSNSKPPKKRKLEHIHSERSKVPTPFESLSESEYHSLCDAQESSFFKSGSRFQIASSKAGHFGTWDLSNVDYRKKTIEGNIVANSLAGIFDYVPYLLGLNRLLRYFPTQKTLANKVVLLERMHADPAIIAGIKRKKTKFRGSSIHFKGSIVDLSSIDVGYQPSSHSRSAPGSCSSLMDWLNVAPFSSFKQIQSCASIFQHINDLHSALEAKLELPSQRLIALEAGKLVRNMRTITRSLTGRTRMGPSARTSGCFYRSREPALVRYERAVCRQLANNLADPTTNAFVNIQLNYIMITVTIDISPFLDQQISELLENCHALTNQATMDLYKLFHETICAQERTLPNLRQEKATLLCSINRKTGALHIHNPYLHMHNRELAMRHGQARHAPFDSATRDRRVDQDRIEKCLGAFSLHSPLLAKVAHRKRWSFCLNECDPEEEIAFTQLVGNPIYKGACQVATVV